MILRDRVVIGLVSDVPASRIAEMMQHEAKHAGNEQNNVGDDAAEEVAVRSGAASWTSVMIINPIWRRYWNALIEEAAR